MPRFRFSLKSMIIATAVVALALATLMQPWREWFSAFMLTSVLLLMLLAIPVSIYSRHQQRASCIGFAVVGWGYFALAFVPSVGGVAERHLLARPIAESLSWAVTGSLGDATQFLLVTHTLFLFGLASLGGLVARYYWRAHSRDCRPDDAITRRANRLATTHSGAMANSSRFTTLPARNSQ